MEAIEKLREMDRDNLIPYGNGDYRPDTRHGQIADEIEREIAEKYLLLPVDADGVPIHVGDYLQLGDTRGEVVALMYCPANDKFPWEWQCDTGDWYNTAFAYHVKPRTLEDVLNDFGRKFAENYHYPNAEGLVDETADEIRELMKEGGDD